MKVLLLGILSLIFFEGWAQNPKYVKVLHTLDSSKIKEISHEPDFQETIDNELMRTVRDTSSSLTKTLLKLGANPHLPCTNCFGKDAMSIALVYNNEQAYYDLVPYYKFDNSTDVFGQNILFFAAANNIEILQDVITRFNPPFEKSDDGNNPISFCWDKDTILSLPKIKLLMEHYKLDASVLNFQPFNELNLLSYAVYNADFTVVQELVAMGADPFLFKKDVADVFKHEDYYFSGSAFHNSLSMANDAFFNYFSSMLTTAELENEMLFDFRIKDSAGVYILISNAAMFLAENTNKSFLDKFKESDINFNYIEDKFNDTPMLTAIENNNMAFVQFMIENVLWDRTFNKTALKWSSEKGINKEMKPMIKKYLKTNVFY